MFDIDFSEIIVVAVVALIVIGPEQLPKVARTLGHLFGRVQRYAKDIKADISRDLALDELREAEQKMKQEIASAEQAFIQTTQQVDQQVEQFNLEANPLINQSPIKHFSSIDTQPAETKNAEHTKLLVEQ